MGWNRSARFYCEVDSARKTREKICSDARSGLLIKAAGEHGMIQVYTYAERAHDIIGKVWRHEDRFQILFCPWRNSSVDGPPIQIAAGLLDYGRVNWDAEVRLDEDTVEKFRMLQAINVLSK